MPRDRASTTTHRIALAVILVLTGSLVVASMMPPAAIPADADDTVAAAGRAVRHVDVIADEPHPLGSPQNLAVRNYLVDQLTDLGLEPVVQTAMAPDFYGTPGNQVEVANVMARIPGTASTGSILLIAHYDSVDTTPGANDNAVAVGALLETARAVLAGEPLRNDVIILATDAEEPAGRFGATTFARNHPWASDVAVAVNFEAAGGTGPALLVEAPGPNRWLIEAWQRGTRRPVAYSFLPNFVGAIGEVGTDFDVFRGLGIPGLHFAYTHDASIYHTMADNRAAVGERSLQHHCDHAYAMATTLGGVDFGTSPRSGDVVFFTAGPRLITYSTGFGAVAAVLPALGLIGAWWALGRRRRITPRRIIGAALRTLGGSIVAAILAAVVWTAFSSARSTPGLIESYLYLGLLIAVAGALVGATNRTGRQATTAEEHAVGIVGLWSLVGVVIGLLAPATGYLFLWPAWFAAIAVAAGSLGGVRHVWHRAARSAVVIIPTLVIMIPAIDVFFQFAMPRPGNPDSNVPAVVGVAILLAALTVELVRATTTDRLWGVDAKHGGEIPLQ
ncbi:MAG: M28 family peptidase [Acidimicrobiia bacterium]|nr:M28 family peptidase [Acidimicrobiia bacterium]